MEGDMTWLDSDTMMALLCMIVYKSGMHKMEVNERDTGIVGGTFATVFLGCSHEQLSRYQGPLVFQAKLRILVPLHNVSTNGDHESGNDLGLNLESDLAKRDGMDWVVVNSLGDSSELSELESDPENREDEGWMEVTAQTTMQNGYESDSSLEEIVGDTLPGIMTSRSLNIDGVKSVMLKITYRMHERLADLPGVLSYGGLLSAHAATHSSTWNMFSSWFGSSRYALLRRDQFQHARAIKTTKGNRNYRRIFINLRSRSSKAEASMSTVNYANINAICDFIHAFLQKHEDEAENIVVLIPFRAQLNLLQEQLWIRDPICNVRACTIDSFQDGENEIVLLCLSTANENDPAFICFLNKWNRINVAITRPKQALVRLGNMDLWRTSNWFSL
ncbi:hypothetical protein B7463_g685, partial [Scytalidium lignicola]